MGTFTYVIKDEAGVHARPAGELVKKVKGLSCAVTIQKGEKVVDASRLMAIMGLCIKKGDEITVAADDEETLEELKRFFEENL